MDRHVYFAKKLTIKAKGWFGNMYKNCVSEMLLYTEIKKAEESQALKTHFLVFNVN